MTSNKKIKRRLTEEELRTIRELWTQGWSDERIAKKLTRVDETTGENITRHRRTIQEARKRHNWTGESKTARVAKSSIEKSMPIGHMPRDQRMKFIHDRFKQSSRCTMMLKTLASAEQKMFEEEYMALLEEFDDFTLAEEQDLFLCVYELCLAFRSQRLRGEQEQRYRETKEGKYDAKDPRFTTHIDDRWEKEYSQHFKNHQDIKKALQMSRVQRLDKEVSKKIRFVDYAYSYAESAQQEEAAREIMELERKTDEELKEMIKNGYLLGASLE